MTTGSGDGSSRGRNQAAKTPGPTRTSQDLNLRLAEGTRLADRYRIEELIGVGAMGLVYRAFDQQLELEVAVKVLRTELAEDPRLLARFRRELVLARQVTHRNAVRIHDIGRDGDLIFLTMDYISGRSLREVLDRDGPLSPERADRVLRQLASALAAAHEQGVVHRDLKPENVLIDESGEAFITDFGVARSVTTAGLTRAGAVVGTLDYLSPEQARGGEVDGRSDLYALGLLLFEMLSGRLPFDGGSHEEVLAQRLTGQPASLGQFGVDTPEHLARVIDRCLQREPARRYASAAELLSDLDSRKTASKPSAWLPRAAAVLGLVGLFGAAWWALDYFRQPGPADAVGEAATAPHAVAVLPFADETGRAEWAWLSAGVAEMLTATLAETPELRVVDHPRVLHTLEGLRLENTPLDQAELRQLAEVLAVDRLVTGRLRSLDPGLRVDLSLVTADSAELSTEALQAEVRGPAQMRELVGELVTEMHRSLEVGASLATAHPTPEDPIAMEAFSLGVRSLTQGDVLQARTALERSVEIAPDYAPAWLRLAQAYDALGMGDRAVEAADRAVAGLAGADSRTGLEAQALHARLAGNPERAQEILQRLVDHFPNDSEARVALAEAYGEQGDLANARAALDAVVKRDALHPRAWYLLAKYTIMAGDSRTAIDEHLVHALVIQNKLRNRQGQADVLNAMGVAYHRLDQLDQAAEHYGRAAGIRKEIGDQRGYATSLRNVAMVDTVRGRYDDAETHLETARGILEQIGDKAGAAGLLTDLGVLAEERGDYRGALGEFRQALKLTEEVSDRAAMAESYNNVGYAYYLLGEYDNAQIYWRQTADLYSEAGSEAGSVQVTQNLGLIDLARGDWNRAAAAFLEALESSRRLEMVAAEAVSLGALGELALLQGRFAPARESIEGALELVREIGDPRGAVEFTLLKAELELALGRLEAAATLLDETEQWLADSPNREQEATVQQLRGQLALARGDAGRAGELFEQAEQLAAGGGGALVPLRATLGRARASLASGAAGQAVQLLDTLRDRTERLGHLPLILQVEEALAEARLATASAETAVEVSRRALARVEQSGGYGRAFRLHHIRAQGQQLQTPGSGASALASAREELERLRGQIAAEHLEAFEARPEVRELVAPAQVVAGVEDVG